MNNNTDNSGLEKANKLLQQGQIQEATTEYRRCIKSIPSQSWSHYYLGDVLTQLEDWEGAAEAYGHTIALGDNYLCYYHLGVALVKLQRWDEAIKVLNRGLELNSGNYEFYFLLGPALVQKQDWQAAIDVYRQAVRLKPAEPEFNLPLGQLLLQEGIFQEAISYLEWSVNFNSDDPQLQLGLGMALVEVGVDLNKAENCLNKSLEIHSNQPRAYFYLGQLFRQRGRLHEALGFYRRSWELKPEIDCGFALVAVLEQLGRWLEVVEQYRQILFEFGESGAVLFGLGKALITLERPAEAVVELRRAMGQGWENPELHDCLAKAFLGFHRYDEAIIEWEKFLAMQPGNTVMRKRLALTLMGLGRWSAASLQWQRYLQVAPGGSQGGLIDFRPMLGMYGEIPHSEKLSIKGDLTVEFWLYLRQWPNSWTNIVGKLVNDGQNEFCLRLKNGKEGQWYYGKGNECVNPLRWVPEDKMALHEWVHIACVRKIGESGQLYINGVLQGERDWKEQPEALEMEVPVRLMVSSCLNEFLDGMLSDVRVWQVARTGDEISQAMYERMTGEEVGLVSVWYNAEENDLIDVVGEQHGKIMQVLDAGKPRLRIGICALKLSDKVTERVNNLVQLYEGLTPVELISYTFPQEKEQVSAPMHELNIPDHSMQVENEEMFIEQAVTWVLANPYEIVHLFDAVMPNIILGLLYKVLWNAQVIFDIDEELNFGQAGEPSNLEAFFATGAKLPQLTNLLGQEWYQIAGGLAKEFDGVTVANMALQKSYGGTIIRYSIDNRRFMSSAELKLHSREKFGITEDKRVVLFFVTPGESKGLFATAEALASLECQDVVLAVIGDFPDGKLKEKLLAIANIEYLFVEDQSFRSSDMNIMAMGDICVLLQDENPDVSSLEVSAKLWNALGMGLVVILSETIAIADLIELGAVVPVGEADLPGVLDQLLSDPAECDRLRDRVQELLTTEFSLDVNKSRLAEFINRVGNESKVLSDRLNLLLTNLPAIPDCLEKQTV